MDWLVVGLGNPGAEYSKTRHNAGFMALDALAARWDVGRAKQRYRARIAEGRMISEGARTRVALLWPQTFMNEAGRSASPARGALRVPLERLLVVHDEIDLPFGEVRSRFGGGLAGHNGLRSLRRELGSPDFWRVRIGVGRPPSTDPEIVAAYVLSAFRESRDDVSEMIVRACDEVERVITDGGER
ncbi:MAG: aminoacyl-tRNA hydrolase [Solirubrobacteraceae bacterium]